MPTLSPRNLAPSLSKGIMLFVCFQSWLDLGNISIHPIKKQRHKQIFANIFAPQTNSTQPTSHHSGVSENRGMPRNDHSGIMIAEDGMAYPIFRETHPFFKKPPFHFYKDRLYDYIHFSSIFSFIFLVSSSQIGIDRVHSSRNHLPSVAPR